MGLSEKLLEGRRAGKLLVSLLLQVGILGGRNIRT